MGLRWMPTQWRSFPVHRVVIIIIIIIAAVVVVASIRNGKNIAPPPFFLRIERYALTSPVSLRQTRRATQISRPTVGQWGCTNSRGGKHAPWTKTDDRDEDGIYSKFGWLVVRTFFTRRFERFRSTSFRRDNRDRNGRTSHSHVPFLSAIIVITIEHRRASHSDWERREGGEKKCVETCRSIEARSTQLLRNAIHSITYVFIRQIGDERTASTRKWKLAANSYGFWRLSGFLTTPSANCLILKKKKKNIRNVSREATSATRILYIFVSFSLTRFQLFHPSPLPRKETYNCLSKSNEKKEKLF